MGSAVIEELLRRNHQLTALADRRRVDERGGAVRVVQGDLFNDRALDNGMRGADAVVHLVGIIMERRSKGVTFERIHFQGARNVINAAVRNGVKRFVQMSALGVRVDAVSDYHKTKYRAEQYLRATKLQWTIFRPSLIHGPNGEFMRMEAKWARGRSPPFLFMPYFGAGPFGFGGAGLLQPIFVGDVARAFADALENPRTVGEVYEIGGRDRVTWPEMHRTIAGAIAGRPRRWVMAIPVWNAKLLTRLAPGELLGFNRDQVIMSQENNVADLSKFRDHFGWEPQPFEASLRGYAKSL